MIDFSDLQNLARELFDDLDSVREAIRQELIDEIEGELESAIIGAESPEAPEEGNGSMWGRNDLPGLRSFLEYFCNEVKADA